MYYTLNFHILEIGVYRSKGRKDLPFDNDDLGRHRIEVKDDGSLMLTINVLFDLLMVIKARTT